MSLKNLRKIIVYNGLDYGVTDFVVVYHESNKSPNNWHNLGAVNVETLKNILWSRRVPFSRNCEMIRPLSTIEEKAGHICFGSNDGYWQVYFTCADLGRKYRLERNDCKMTLSQKCHDQDLKIELMPEEKCSAIKVKFEISSLSAEFKAIEGEPIPKGMKVWIRNRTESVVNVSSFVLLETRGSASKVNVMAGRQKAFFDEKILKPYDAIVSKEGIPFDCFDHKHHAELFFTAEGNCYGIQEKKSSQISLKLSESDYGNVIDIDIISQKSNPLEITVKIRTSREEKCHKAEMMGSISERKQMIRKAVEDIRNIPFEEHAKVLIQPLKKLAAETGKEEADFFHGPDSELIHLQQADSNSELEEVTIDGLKFKVAGEPEVSLTSLKELASALDQFKEIWKKVNDSLFALDLLLEMLDTEEDAEMNRISKDSKIICCMCVTDVLCSLLRLTGLEEDGLTFHTSDFHPDKKLSICPGELYATLEQELSLWKLSIFSNASKTVLVEEIMSKQLLICQDSLVRLEEMFAHVRLRLIEDLRRIASDLHRQSRNVNISMLTSSSLGVVGAGLTVAGFVAAPFTAGASLSLVAAGVGVGVASGAVGIGTTIADGVLTGKSLRSTVSLAESYVRIQNWLFSLRSMVLEQSPGDHLSPRTGEGYFRAKNVADAASSTVANVGVTVAKAGAQVAKTGVFRVGSVAFGLIFDLAGLVVRSINMSRGALSELGCKLEAEASLLEMEWIEETNSLYLLASGDDDEKKKKDKEDEELDAELIQSLVVKYL